MFNLNYILIMSAVVVIAIGQITFKFAAQNLRFLPSQTLIPWIHSNIIPICLVIVALMLYLASTIAWVQALRTVPLSVAFMFNSLAFIIVPLAAFLLFDEPIPRFFVPGLLLIVGGVILVSLG